MDTTAETSTPQESFEKLFVERQLHMFRAAQGDGSSPPAGDLSNREVSGTMEIMIQAYKQLGKMVQTRVTELDMQLRYDEAVKRIDELTSQVSQLQQDAGSADEALRSAERSMKASHDRMADEVQEKLALKQELERLQAEHDRLQSQHSKYKEAAKAFTELSK